MRTVLLGLIASLTEFRPVRAVQLDFEGHTRLGLGQCSGLHCAPSAHRTLGTFPRGTVRFSFGWFNTAGEIEASLEALGEIAVWAAKGSAVSAGDR